VELLQSDAYLQAIVQMAEHVQSLAKKEQCRLGKLVNPAEVRGCQIEMLHWLMRAQRHILALQGSSPYGPM
jgi:hypothetical protein